MDDAATSYLVFSDDWGGHQSSSQHLFGHIGRDHAVLWVNTIGMRNPKLTLTDFRKAVRKIIGMIAGTRTAKTVAVSAPAMLHVCQPFMLPFSNLSLVRKFNRWSVRRNLKMELQRLGMRHPTIVSTVPNACDFVEGLGARRVVYYCVDDFTQWPGLERNLVADMEAHMIAVSDVLIATSSKLLALLSARGKPVTLLTHGVDLELFSSEPQAEHQCLSAIPAPRIGYFGLFDERSDQKLLTAVAQRLPKYSFVITGPVVADTTALRSCPNVYFTGAVAYRQLPAVVRGLQALFIPYLVNSFTDAISPLKLKEYLVTGKPVIVTAMAEARNYANRLSIASTVDEWVRAIVLSAHADVADRKRLLTQEMADDSWQKKSHRFIEICNLQPADSKQVKS